MEHLYNPDRMTEQEIKQTFVARQKQVDELVTMIERQPEGAGVQHVVIIAPRGMGKTTMLLMIGFAVRDRGLDSRWQTVRFAEESYSITSLADFWLQTITLLAEEVNEPSLQAQASAMAKEFRKNDELQEVTLALLKDWCRQHGKRLVLLVDNFDLILEQINDEQENARLRNLLMNDGTIMLIGGATTFFREARAYDQPLYNFFKIVHLDTLKFEEMQDLLRQRAALDALPNFESTLRANHTRLKVLEYFTGGNPRLVLMLYRIITDSEVVDVRRGLEQLLDQVTPYYKAKLESLPPQQRKILDHIARVSGETHEGLTPTQIADVTRITTNAVSMQLKRLAEQGYVRSANLRGRSAYYTLSEPLYAIWHQMRFGRNARQKMQWLASFLKIWYDATELQTVNKRLTAGFQEITQSGLVNESEASGYADAIPFFPEAPYTRLQRAFAFIGNQQYRQAREELDCASAAAQEQGASKKLFNILHISKMIVSLSLNDDEQLVRNWQNFLMTGFDVDYWHSALAQVLLDIALLGKPQLAREMIASANMEHIFIPVTQALDTLFTGDSTYVEKLSSELRYIAYEMVEKLEQVKSAQE